MGLTSHHTEVNSTGDFLFLEQNMTWRLIAASCTAALLPVTFLSKSAKYVQAEEVEQKRTKIVIVGAGLTGCLTSYLIRKLCGDSVDLKVFEKSPYPSGRFGAGLRYKSEDTGQPLWCDMGSQVLSVLNCEGGHPNACVSGHGMYSEDLMEAWQLVKLLKTANLVSRVPNDGGDEENALDPTSERMIFDNLWAHFWPTNKNKSMKPGLSGIMQYLLEMSSPIDSEFNHQVQFIEWDSGQFVIYSIERGGEEDTTKFCDIDKNHKRNNKCVKIDTADIVIVTIPAPQARSLTLNWIPDFLSKDLENIQYESRASCSLVAKLTLDQARSICQMFGPHKSEINFDLSDSPHVAHLEDIVHTMTWQDRKYHSYETLESQLEEKTEKGDNYVELSFTFHSTVSSSSSYQSKSDFEAVIHKSFKEILSDQSVDILKSRAVIWHLSQPTGPMETLYKEVQDQEAAYPYGSAYVDHGGLILAGDYFTQSSYIGSFCSAAAAARGVRDIISMQKTRTQEIL